MLAEERHRFIVDYVREQGTVTKKELSKLLNVSLETVRRDLELLSSSGLVKKVHGGVMSNKVYTGKYPELDYAKRQAAEQAEKAEIALAALSFVEDGNTIALNAGTTNEALARELLFCGKRLTIVTNSLSVVEIVKDDPNLQVILCGGRFYSEENAFFGALTAQFLENISVDVLFLCVSGVDVFKGCTDYRDEEVGVARRMVSMATKTIVLSSSQKIDSAALLRVCSLDAVECVISDTGVDAETVRRYREMGHEIIVAGARGHFLLDDL